MQHATRKVTQDRIEELAEQKREVNLNVKELTDMKDAEAQIKKE